MQIWMAWALAFFLCIATPAQAMSASKALANPLATGLDTSYYPINKTDPDGLHDTTWRNKHPNPVPSTQARESIEDTLLVGAVGVGLYSGAVEVLGTGGLALEYVGARMGFTALGRFGGGMAGLAGTLNNWISGPKPTTENASSDSSSQNLRFSPQKQGRHVAGHPNQNQGGYFNNMSDAEETFEAFRNGNVEILGTGRNGNTYFRYGNVTGFNNNPNTGHVGQPTNVFFLKGTSGASIVPTNPNWTPP